MEFEWCPWRFQGPDLSPILPPIWLVLILGLEMSSSVQLLAGLWTQAANHWTIMSHAAATSFSWAQLPPWGSQHSCRHVTLLNPLRWAPLGLCHLPRKSQNVLPIQPHTQRTWTLLKLPLLPSCCGGADPMSTLGSSWPFSSGMCWCQRGQQGKEQAGEESWLWSEGTLQLWTEANPRGRTVTFLLTTHIKERPVTRVFSCAPRPAAGLSLFLSSLTHRREAEQRLMGADVVEKPSAQNVSSVLLQRI